MHQDSLARRAPHHLSELLLRRYGRNPFGEPNYRLVWAPARLERSGGLWNDWAGGARSRGGLLRRVAEVRWVRKYPGEVCWLVEQWTPPAAYGTPEQWGRPVAEGGTRLVTSWGSVPALGPYPELGDYEDLGARMYWYPSERHLTLAVDASRRARARRAAGARQRVREATLRAEREEQARDVRAASFCDDVLTDASPAFHGAPMAGSGAKRRPSLVTMAEGIGIRQHPF